MSVTRGALRTRVRQRLGDDGSTPAHSTALLDALIDERLRVRAASLIARLAPNFYLSTTTFVSVANTANYAMPADFGFIIKVERRYGDSPSYTYVEIPYHPAEDLETVSTVPFIALPDTISRLRKSWTLIGSDVYLYPTPVDTSETYRVKYGRRVADAANDNANLDMPDEFAGLIELDCVTIIWQRTGDPRLPSLLAERREELVNTRQFFRRRKTPNLNSFDALEMM